MRSLIPLFMAILFQLNDAVAAEQADVIAFNGAWSQYAAAIETSDVPRQIETAERVLSTGRVVIEPTDERLPVLMLNLGKAYLEGKQKDKARAVLEEALELSEALYGKSSEKLLVLLPNLADSRSMARHPGRQLKIYKRALRIAAEHYGKESKEYANLALIAALNVYEKSKSKDGKKFLIDAHDYYLENEGPESLNTGVAAFYLGQFEFSQGKYKRSIDNLLSSIVAFESAGQDAVESQLFARALLVQAYETRGKTDLATEQCIAIGRLSPLRPKSDYLPLFRMAPSYPKSMLLANRSGFVDISFTVDKNGFVREPKIINVGKDSRGFEDAALLAVERFRYAPRVEDSHSVSVDGVTTRISFKIE